VAPWEIAPPVCKDASAPLKYAPTTLNSEEQVVPAAPDSPRPSDPAFTRSDPEATGRFLEELFPDPDLRRSLLSILAKSIEEAHRSNPGSWSLTLGVRDEYLRLNVGRILAFTLTREMTNLILEADSRRHGDENFRAIEGVILRALPPAKLVAEWPSLSSSHLRAIARAATQVRKTIYRQSHSPGVLAYMSQFLSQPIPEPEHEGAGGEPLKSSPVEKILRLLRSHYPGWNGFDHPAFYKDEIGYKQATIDKARRDLAESELRRLLAEEQHEEFIRRLEAIGKDNNLLYRSMPRQGDLNILYQEDLDKPGFCSAMLDLLYGENDSPERLGRYLAWVKQADLPSKWTFPTYFLFVCRPESEIFVKPGTTRAFLGLLGIDEEIRGDVTPGKYELIRDVARSLVGMLAKYEPRDMVDIQSVFWVCGRAIKDSVVPTEVENFERESQPPYSLAECSAKTGCDEVTLERWVRSIHRKGQAILYGPPGTGKTHTARELAQYLIGGGDGFSELVQFHPSYSYEEFIQGIRPEPLPDGGLDYPLKKGRFLDFCDRAADRKDTCVLIIDEINRANLSRVFGELMYLLEYRDQAIPLAAGRSFSIPENVRILGTMNTADRSIALVDHALRRRFAFIELSPNFDVLSNFHAGTSMPVDSLIDLLKRVNREIGNPHYEIGITFFLDEDLDRNLEDIWTMEIYPYLEEYFFDQREKSTSFRWEQVRRELGL
jgi:hypothetical protein